MGETFANLATNGPLLAAVGVAALAGLVSFLSPCVLPLVPGYLSYVTGMAGADLDAALGTDPHGRAVPTAQPVVAGPVPAGGRVSPAAPVPPGGSAAGGGPVDPAGGSAASRAVARRGTVRGRILGGTLLFILGFTAVFVTVSVVFARVGQALSAHARLVEIVVGAGVIVLGAAFAGLIPGMQREFRIRALPNAGLAGAPVLGAVFGLGWTPCVGPTLGAVLGLATVSGQQGRAVTLAVAYCLGLGLPFLAFGLGFRRVLSLFAVVRRHTVWITRLGGALLILVGLALVTGGWTDFTIWLRTVFGPGTVSI